MYGSRARYPNPFTELGVAFPTTRCTAERRFFFLSSSVGTSDRSLLPALSRRCHHVYLGSGSVYNNCNYITATTIRVAVM